MNFLRGSVFRVGGALVVGAGLIGIAFFVQKNTEANTTAQLPAITVARGDVRTVQPALDTDKDGLPDWEEALRGTDPNAYTSPEEAYPVATTTTEPYTTPTTVTDRFAEQFLERIIRTGAGKDITEEEKIAIVNQSLGTLAADTADPLVTQADIKSVPQNDLVSLRAYGNALGDVFLTPSAAHENELVILERAVTTNDLAVLDALKPIEEAYAGMVRDVLLIETPSVIAKQQVDLINALSLVHTDIVAMQNVFTDPLASFVRIRRFESDARSIASALDAVRIALEQSGVVYTSQESGIALFSLRP